MPRTLPPCVIESLHKGMNLRDVAQAIEPGETGLSVGCDFSKAGQIAPLREGLLTWTHTADIQDAHIIYLDEVRYIFTTHADGLRVRTGDGDPVLIDASFTGAFRIWPINEDWVALMNATLCKKWKPGWASTYQWGINTPSAPTLASWYSKSKLIDDFESTSGFVLSGGGGGGAIALDSTNYKSLLKSLKITCDAANTAIVTKTGLSFDFTKVDVSDDAGLNPCINFWVYAYSLPYVSSLELKFSCEISGGFTSDYYAHKITVGGVAAATLAHIPGEMYAVADQPQDQYPYLPDLPSSIGNYPYFGQSGMSAQYDPNTQKLTVTQVKDDDLGTFFSTTLDGAGNKIDLTQMIIQAKARRTYMATGWTEIKIPLAEFIRHGDATGRDWSTITAMQISVTAVTGQANVSFDFMRLTGGGDLWGYYWVAVAYQNSLGNYGPYTDFVGPVYVEGEPLRITGLTPDTDGQTIKRRIAILGGSTVDPMVTYLEDNTSTELDFYGLSGTLITVEKSFNNLPPTPGRDLVEHGGRLFIVGPTNYRNRLIYSEPLYYEAFPANNYRVAAEGEDLYQVAVISNLLAMRGTWREWILSLGSSEPASWTKEKGAREGSVSSRLLLDLGGGQVFMSDKGLYLSQLGGEQGYYLPKINDSIANPREAIGGLVGKKAYIYFQDVDGVDRIMRIDFTRGDPVAHYVANIRPTAIIEDQVGAKIYYAYGSNIYEFDAGTLPLPATLVIPGQYCKTHKQKAFVSMIYGGLDNGPLAYTLKTDRKAISGTFSLPSAYGVSDPKALPCCEGRNLEVTLTSTVEDFILYLPIEIEFYPVAD